jgi:hypothetical protein
MHALDRGVQASRLACGSILEVSRDAAAAGEEQLIRRAAEQCKYYSTCAVAPDLYGNLHFTSWGRWQCQRGGADVGLNSCYAACGCGTECRCGVLPGGRGGGACGDILEAMARIAPSQPNGAMACIAPRSPMANNQILLVSS